MKNEWIEKYMFEAERMIVQGGDQLDSGMNILNNLLFEEPGYGNLHNHLGWAHLYFTLDYIKAEIHLEAAIKFHADFHAPYLHLGTLYLRTANYEGAIGILSTGLTKAGANKSAMLEMIGQSHEMMKRYPLAIKAYREAMLSTLATHEMNIYSEGIKRCRKKKWSSMFA